MFQSIDPAAAEVIEKDVEKSKEAFAALKGLSFDDAIHQIANGMVSFAFKLLIALVVLYVGKWIIKRLYRFVNSMMQRKGVDRSLETFVLSLVKFTFYFLLIIIVIGILGIETSSFLALFASAGVAIGMALSGTLQNFAGGVLILLLKPYKVGDYIEAQGYAGTVKEIQIFHTVINTPDNKAIIIPNGGLSTSSVNNYSLEEYRRVDWTIALAYGTDYDAAAKAIRDILLSDERVDAGTEPGHEGRVPFVGLNELADSSINIVARGWTSAANYWPLFFDINRRIYTELPRLGFSFPFPQLDVHLDRIDMQEKQ